MRPLCHDAFKIVLARQLKELRTALVDMIDVPHRRFDRRPHAEQAALSHEQGQCSQVSPIERERIEGAEMGRPTAEHQGVEVGSSVTIEADNLTVQDGGPGTDRPSNLTIHIRPLLQLVAVAAHQAALTILDVRERAKAVQLQLENEILVVKRPRDAQQRHGMEHGCYNLINLKLSPSDRGNLGTQLESTKGDGQEMTTPNDAHVIELPTVAIHEAGP